MSRPRPKVVYWNHSPTPYFVERFNAVVQRGTLNFEAWFNDRREAIRSWEVSEEDWLFPARYIPRRRLLGWQERIPVAELIAARPDVLVQEYDRSHLTAGFIAGTRLAHRTAFRVLPNFDTWSQRTWWREVGKRFVFNAVDAAKVPGADGARLAERYGLTPDRIEYVTQSVNVDRFAGARDLAPDDRQSRRAALGLSGCVFVYVGRLWAGKGVDDLFSAFEGLVGAGRDVSLLMVGDGPDEHRYRSRAEGLPQVVFTGFVQAPHLPTYYGLADAMVFPTLGDPHGLVVEEAMVAGLPVICTTSAGDIAARLPDGEAGFVVRPGDALQLEGRMLSLVDDARMRVRMGSRAAELATRRSHERYADDFEAFVRHTLDRPARTGWIPAASRLAGRALEFQARHTEASAVIEPRGTLVDDRV